MKKTQDKTSFEKGEAFEDYVQNNLFTKERYTLISRTHDYKQNSERYVEDSKKPDFTFRCKNSKKLFYVEVKYRTRFVEDKLDIISPNQFNRFKEIHRTECPVFIAIGYEGSPSNPGGVSLIRIDQLEYLSVYKSVIKKHDVKKAPFENSVIENLIDQVKIEVDASLKGHQTPTEKAKPKLSKNAIILILVILGLLTASFLILQNLKSGSGKNQPAGFVELNDQATEQKIKDTIYKYYEAVKGNNADAMGYFINNNVDRWYGKYNVSLAYILKDNQRYFKKFPFREVEINWDSFKIFELPNGDFNANYAIVYKLKSDFQSAYKRHNLKIHSIWTKDFKIKSMYEEKLN